MATHWSGSTRALNCDLDQFARTALLHALSADLG